MGIKCSLLGHDYTETDVTEEREEEGSEVVITVKEVETCANCGKTRVVSENKEVTSLAAEDGTPTGGDAGPDATGGDMAPDIDAAEDDAELIGEAESGGGGGTGSETTGGDAGTAGTDQRDVDAMTDPEPTVQTEAETVAPEADDAVILDDGEESARDPGEWPEEADDGPEAETETEPADAPDLEASEAEIDTAGEQAAVASAGESWPDEYGYEEESTDGTSDAAWPEDDGGTGDDWTPTDSLTQSIDDASVERAGAATATVPDGEFACPACEFTTPVEESSLRAGDFCPECRRGALEHRPESETRKE